MSDPTHHSAVAQGMLVPAVPALVGHTEDYVPTRPNLPDSEAPAPPTRSISDAVARPPAA